MFLWTAPRVCGTAFERCISQLDGVRTIGEPFFGPFYFGDDRQSHRFDHEVDNNVSSNSDVVGTFFDKHKSLQQVLEELINNYDDSKQNALLYHEQAYHALGFKDKLKPILNDYKYIHTFMIRDPYKAITSQYRCYTDPEKSGENERFLDEYCGFKELYIMFEFIKHELQQNVFIFDAHDISWMIQNICYKNIVNSQGWITMIRC